MLSEIKMIKFLRFSAAETESLVHCTSLMRTEMTQGANVCHICQQNALFLLLSHAHLHRHRPRPAIVLKN